MAITKIQTRALVAAVTDDITANSAKTGITSEQASAITANTAKVTNSTSASDLTSGTLPDAAFPSTLPAASGANLTALPAANITGTLPAISATNLTNVPAANITGTLPAISGANLTGVRDTTGGRKNLIINGGFDVWQRGTSFSGGDEFSADRWKKGLSGGTATATQQAFSVGQTDVPFNPKYFMRCSTSVGNDAVRIEQKIEDVAITSGQNVTISFYAKGTNPGGGSFEIRLGQYFGTGGSADIDRAASDNFTVTSSWQKFSRTITVPSISGKTLGVGNNLDVMFEQSWGIDSSTAAWELNLAQVQLELGSVATDFEHRSYGEELALCLRYFWRDAAIEGWFFPINPSNNVYFRSEIYFPTIMRSSPSVSVDSSITGTQYITNSKVSLRLNHIASYSTWTGITVSAEL